MALYPLRIFNLIQFSAAWLRPRRGLSGSRNLSAYQFAIVCVALAVFGANKVEAAPVSFGGQISTHKEGILSVKDRQLAIFGSEAAVTISMQQPEHTDSVPQLRVANEKQVPLRFSLQNAGFKANKSPTETFNLTIFVEELGDNNVTICARYKKKMKNVQKMRPGISNCVLINITRLR